MPEEEVKQGLEVLLDKFANGSPDSSVIYRYNSLIRNSRALIEQNLNLSPEDLRFNIYAELDPAKVLIPSTSKEKTLYDNGRIEEKLEELSQNPRRRFNLSAYLSSYFGARDTQENLDTILSSINVREDNINQIIPELFSTPNQKRYGKQIEQSIRLDKRWLKTMYNQAEKAEKVLGLLQKAADSQSNKKASQEIAQLRQEFGEIKDIYNQLGGDEFLDRLPQELEKVLGKTKEIEKVLQLLQMKNSSGQEGNKYLRNDGRGLDYIILEETEFNGPAKPEEDAFAGNCYRIAFHELRHLFENNFNEPLRLYGKSGKNKWSPSDIKIIRDLIKTGLNGKYSPVEAYKIIKLHELKGRKRAGEEIPYDQIIKECGGRGDNITERDKKLIDQMWDFTTLKHLENLYHKIYYSKEQVKKVRKNLQRKEIGGGYAKEYISNIEKIIDLLRDQATNLQEELPIFSNQTIRGEKEDYHYTSIVEDYIEELDNLKTEVAERKEVLDERTPQQSKKVNRITQEPYRINLNEKSIFDYMEEFEESLKELNNGALMNPYEIKILDEEYPTALLGENKTEALRNKINKIMELKGYLKIDSGINPDIAEKYAKYFQSDDDNKPLTISERIQRAAFEFNVFSRTIFSPQESKEAYKKAWDALISYDKTKDIKDLSPKEAFDLSELKWLKEPKEFPINENETNHYASLKSLLEAANNSDIKGIEREAGNLFLSDDPKLGLQIQIKPQIIEYIKKQYSMLDDERKEIGEKALKICEQFNGENLMDYASFADKGKLANFLAKYSS